MSTEKTDLDEKKDVAIPMDDLDESKAQLIKSNVNGGATGDVAVGIIDPTSGSSDGDVSFNGLGKDEVLQYANDPFWVRLRWILFILFWVGWAAMLVTAIVIIVLAPRCPPRPDLKWYEKDTIYQVNTKSFKDSAKDDKTPMDGFGDFKGLKEKLDYITDTLGSKAVYLNSIYKTDKVDGAPHLNDLAIIDHKMLDERFGTDVNTFKSWVKDSRKNGVQIVLDLFPNQVSKKHDWYEKAINGDAKFKDFFIWAKSGGADNWTEEPKLGEYYYHSLSTHLPDLNLSNEAVREEIANIMKFWLNAGVGGFRINGLDYLVEDNGSQDNGNETSGGTLGYLEELRSVADSYSDKPGRERFIFGSVTTNGNDTKLYYQSDDEDKAKRLHMVIPHMNLDGSCNAECLIDRLRPVLDPDMPWVGLQLSNENTPRIGAQMAAKSKFHAGIKTAHALQMLLPGTPFNYYGDELGLKGGQLAKIGNEYNPMNSRTPMQWNGRDNAGFSDVAPWLSLGQDYQTDNVENNQAHFKDHSILGSFIKLVELREKESFQWGKVEACPDTYNKDVLLFTRKAKGFPFFLVMINTGSASLSVHLPSTDCVQSRADGKVVFHSKDKLIGDKLDLDDYATELGPGDIVVYEFAV